MSTFNSINSALSITYKAQAVAELLIKDGQSNQGFESEHHIVISSIFALSDYLREIEQQLDKPSNF